MQIVGSEPGPLCVARMRAAVLSGEADAALHAADDLPSGEHDRLHLIAVLSRGDPRDVLCTTSGTSFRRLRPGARVSVAGPRRELQLSALRPDLTVAPLEDDIRAAIARSDAVVVSSATVVRLGLQAHVSDIFSLDQLVPGAGQGALVLEARSDDRETLQLVAGVNHPMSRLQLDAERAVLRRLQAWSAASIGAVAEFKYGTVTVRGVLAAPAGAPLVRVRRSGPAATSAQVAEAVASALLLQETSAGSWWP